MAPNHQANTTHATQAPKLRRRLACWFYEGMLLFAVVFIADYLFSTLSQTRHALDNRHAQQAFLFVVLGIYFTWLWSRGQTLAMKTWHIRVVSAQGQKLSQSQAFLRYLTSWLWVMPPLMWHWLASPPLPTTLWLLGAWVAFWALSARLHPQHQYWHDALAGTRLVSVPAGTA